MGRFGNIIPANLPSLSSMKLHSTFDWRWYLIALAVEI